MELLQGANSTEQKCTPDKKKSIQNAFKSECKAQVWIILPFKCSICSLCVHLPHWHSEGWQEWLSVSVPRTEWHRNMGETSKETGLSQTWQCQFTEIGVAENSGKTRAEMTEFTHGRAKVAVPTDRFFFRDKVPPHKVKPCLLVLETDKFSALGQSNGKLVFSELVWRFKAASVLPAFSCTF